MSLDVDSLAPAEVDGCAGLDVTPSSPLPALCSLHVTAVLVSHDGAAYLPRTLGAVTAQTRPLDELIAVDTGSQDASPQLSAEATDRLLTLPRRTSLGDAVRAALDVLDAVALTPARDPRPDRPVSAPTGVAADRSRQWLWLLHDDSAPAPDVLQRLLVAVDTAPSVGIAGCKQVGWDDERQLIDVGFTTSPLGKLVTGVDIDDLDQGQLDDRSDVLAVSSAGMLVRRDVWDLLGGPDPALSQARDDLDLCRRAHLAGFRVLVVPHAVVAHAGAGRGARRRAESGSWRRADRRDAIHLRLAATAWPLLPFVLAWTVLAGLWRAAGRLALKQPSVAADELAALAAVLLRPAAWLRARRRGGAVQRVPRRALHGLFADRRQVLRHRRDAVSAHLRAHEEAWAAAEAASAVAATRAAAQPPSVAVEAGPVGEDAHAAPVLRSRPRRRGASRFGPGLLLTAGAGAGLLGVRGLLPGTGTAAGPALPPLPPGADELWRSALSSWRPVGLGGAATADPLLAALAVLSLPFGGAARTAVAALLLAAVPLAGLSAWAAASALTSSIALRCWAALSWAAAPALLGSLGPGRVGAVLAHVMLPLAALGLARAVALAGPASRVLRGSLPAAAGAGLALTMVIAGAPALALPAALAVALAAIAARAGRRLLLWTVLIPAVLLLPWWSAVIRDPVLLLAEPGRPTGPATLGDAGWHLALLPSDPAGLAGIGGPAGWWLGHVAGLLPGPGGAQLVLQAAAVLVAAPVVLLGLAGLLASGRRALAAGALLGCGLAGLAVAVAAPRLLAAVAADGMSRAWPGAGVCLLTLGVLGAALAHLDGAAARLRRHSLGGLHAVAVVLGVLAVLGPAGGLAGWASEGALAPGSRVHRVDPDVLPAVAAAEAAGPAATRTLVLRDTAGQVRWWLARGAGARLGDASAALTQRPEVQRVDRAVIAPLVATLLSDGGVDVRGRLAAMGVGSVLLLPPADERAVAALDAAAGLVRVAQPRGAVLWRVDRGTEPAGQDGAGGGAGGTRPARVRIVEPVVSSVTAGVPERSGGGVRTLPSAGLDVSTRIPDGAPGRLLVLAEHADRGWRADLDGRALPATSAGGWAQSFRLPVSGGQLRVWHQERWQGLIDAARLAMLGLAAIASVPLPRWRRRWGTPRRPRPAADSPATGRPSAHRPSAVPPVAAGTP